ncbi:RNase adapter RapZ [Calditerricola satsumensis]|uniref:Nucleotide-binding protein YvcJ n=1 Tax=Calditerricola satsumensis TaxID=373054 RepID=A0A8J3BEX5_9BACI|nr:RNase adapter RapZ [Calditerricola satsumensis]GGK02437.1 nucleotide-binding protein YvcJ [Calditerricola satsumensis]
MADRGGKQRVNLVIITGMSGAGKTVAMQSLEDLGFFCVDNLPPVLIPKFAEVIQQSGGQIEKVALVIDLRGREFFRSLFDAFEQLAHMPGVRTYILFLDASDSVLVQRYKETRRRHPMAADGSVLDGIRRERQLLEELKGRANEVIDTTNLRPAQLKERLMQRFGQLALNRLTVHVVSFGFKYGLPLDADLVFDVRFLPNPHYIPALRPQTGRDPAVYDYVFQWKETQEFVDKLLDLLRFLLPYYEREGKNHVVIGIGCTGGRHRSVAIAEHVARAFRDAYAVTVTHRDMQKDHPTTRG